MMTHTIVLAITDSTPLKRFLTRFGHVLDGVFSTNTNKPKKKKGGGGGGGGAVMSFSQVNHNEPHVVPKRTEKQTYTYPLSMQAYIVYSCWCSTTF